MSPINRLERILPSRVATIRTACAAQTSVPGSIEMIALWGARLLGAALIALSALMIAQGPADAASVNIVALGASNTAGKGVGEAAAWPAQLERLLRARGYDAHVTNEGIGGDDTGRMLARLDGAVPDGTQIVILEKAATNDHGRGVDTDANIAAMSRRLAQRHIKVIVIPGMHGWANNQLQADGIHITEAGHAAVAARLLPIVIAKIRH